MNTLNPFSLVVATGFGLAVSAGAALAFDAVATSDVNVRSGPGVNYARVSVLNRGEAVNVVECQGSWCFVEQSGPDGWVSGHYLADAGSNGAGAGGSDPAADAVVGAILGAILGGVLSHDSAPPPPAPPAPPVLPYGPDTCVPGYVWRDAIPGDHVCVTPDRRTAAAHENAIAGSRVNPAGAYGPNTCVAGFVWREAYSGDVVCVTGARRTAVHQENIDGPSHRVLAP